MPNRLISIALITFIAATSLLFFPLMVLVRLLTGLFDRKLAVLHRLTCAWASLYLWAFPYWSVSLQGREKIDPEKTYVFVANHQSLLDILLAFRLFVHFKWVSKSEIFALPLIGWNMRLNRYIELKRDSRKGSQKMLEQCKQALAEGNSIFIFPEGTRSTDGSVQSFRLGAFNLALSQHTPIIPIAINGSRDALPKHSLNFHGRQKMRVEVLDELPYGSFAGMTAQELAHHTRDIIESHVERQPKA